METGRVRMQNFVELVKCGVTQWDISGPMKNTIRQVFWMIIRMCILGLNLMCFGTCKGIKY